MLKRLIEDVAEPRKSQLWISSVPAAGWRDHVKWALFGAGGPRKSWQVFVKVRALIDAGGICATASNKEVAHAIRDFVVEYAHAVPQPIWPAGVLFWDSDTGEVMILSMGDARDAEVASRSPIREIDCLVYFDQKHTRGSDQKLPEDAVGAVMVSADQTKDSFMQAIGRLRKFVAATQSVFFYGTNELLAVFRTRFPTKEVGE